MSSAFTDEQEQVLRDVAERMAYRCGFDYDDTLATVWLVAAKMHGTYKPERGSYRWWAVRWVYKNAKFMLNDERGPVHVPKARYWKGERALRGRTVDKLGRGEALCFGPSVTSGRAVSASSRAALISAMGCLDPVEQRVIAERFGLTGDEPRALEDIAARMGWSRETIRTHEQAALSKIRLQLDEMGCGESDL